MRYQISGKQIDIGEALQIHVKDGLEEKREISIFIRALFSSVSFILCFEGESHDAGR